MPKHGLVQFLFRLLCTTIAFFFASSVPQGLGAQTNFPEKPIKLIVPFPAGGVNDVIGRIWAEGVSSQLGPVIIENRGGGGGMVGATEVARSAPDGHTLLLGNTTTQVVGPKLVDPPPYDAVSSFEPISILTVVPNAFAVHPSFPARNLQELVAYAKQNPGKVSFGSAGKGSLTHIAGELLAISAGIELVHVPYRGVAPGLADFVAGHVPMFSASVSAQFIDLHRAGKIRIIAINSQKRIDAALDIPTTAESGYPKLVITSFNGLFAPKGTPESVIKKIAAATNVALKDENVRKGLLNTGGVIESTDQHEKAVEVVKSEATSWADRVVLLRGKI